jgi:hypothetical protein
LQFLETRSFPPNIQNSVNERVDLYATVETLSCEAITEHWPTSEYFLDWCAEFIRQLISASDLQGA